MDFTVRLAAARLRDNPGDRMLLEDWGPGRDSCIWAFNALYWSALELWEKASGRSYEQALPGGESDARNHAAARDLICELFALWDPLDGSDALPAELYVAELGVGNGTQAKVFLDEFRALDRAHEALDQLPEDERRDTAFGYTERQLLFHQGDALITLGDHRGADDAFGQALRLYSPAEFLDRSLVTLGQARCRLQAGEPEEALRLSRDTLLGLPSQHRPGIVLRAAQSLGEAVAAKHGDFPAVRDYREVLISG